MDGAGKWKINGQTVFVALVLAAGVLAYWWMFYQAGYSSGRYEERAHLERQHYAADAAKNLDHNCSAFVGPALRECAYKTVNAEREAQREESDLAAQWKAANWVMWASLVSGLQLIATVIGLIFIKGTLDATWRAVEDTDQATRAMKRQNELTEQAFRHASVTSRAQLRTYLSSVDETYSEEDETGTKFRLGYEYKNVGLTPAHDVTFAIGVGFQTLKRGTGPASRAMGKRNIPYGVIGPGAKNHVPFSLTASPEEVAAVRDARAIIRVIVTIVYRDEFGDRWKLTQNMLVDMNSHKTGVLYTDSGHTQLLEGPEEKQEGELALEGGGEGRITNNQTGKK